MRYYSALSLPARRFSPHGTKIQKIYKEVPQDDGTMSAVVVGQHDINAMIQEATVGTDVYEMISMYNAGDVSAIDKVQGVYGDFTGCAKSFGQLQQSRVDLEQRFRESPAKFRQMFGNDVGKFLNAAFEKGDPVAFIKSCVSDFVAQNQVVRGAEPVKKTEGQVNNNAE